MKIKFKIVNILANLCVFMAIATTFSQAGGTSPELDFSVSDAPSGHTDSPDAKPTAELSAAELFATPKSPGSIAVGVAEGNLTVTGETTSLYWGHTDPGNHVTNRGFCSWNRAKDLTVQQADKRCISALQRQSAATEKKLALNGIDPKINPEALVNGTDLWNQSPGAGKQFGQTYKQAIAKGLKGDVALLDARVEAFRNESGKLDASGLFGICAREAYYQQKLAGFKPYSEAWRWQCIALDQGRRVGAVSKALKQNIGDINLSLETVYKAQDSAESVAELPAELNFEPAIEQKAIAAPISRQMSRSHEAEFALDFSVSDTPIAQTALPKITPQQDVTLAASIKDDNSLDFSVPDTSLVGDSDEKSLSSEEVEDDRVKREITTKSFSGKRITKAGGAIGKCTVTDYRRFRYIQPVSGMPPREHNGVDVACPGGTHAIYSPADGKLTILQPNKSGGGGLVARIKTDDGWIIQNMHVLKITAKPGKIRAGEKIGIGGAPFGHVNAGVGTGAHSHYERFKVVNGVRKYVDPTEKELQFLLGIEP